MAEIQPHKLDQVGPDQARTQEYWRIYVFVAIQILLKLFNEAFIDLFRMTIQMCVYNNIYIAHVGFTL